jgi:sugar phosphate isomerase/epimerase
MDYNVAGDTQPIHSLSVFVMLQLKKSVSLACLGQPFKKAIVTAARLGADAVEVDGLAEVRIDQMTRTGIRHIRKLLSDLNLKVSAVLLPTRLGYGDLEQLDRRVDGTKAALDLAYQLGAEVVVNRVGQIPQQTDDPRWNTMLQALLDIGQHSHKAGAWLAARTGAEPGSRLKELIQALPPRYLTVDFDPAELVINGHSPTDAMAALGEDVTSLRARDAVTDLSLGRGVEVELGRGSVDWAALLGTLEEKNYQGYLTVDRRESEQAVLDCGHALEYLTHLFG